MVCQASHALSDLYDFLLRSVWQSSDTCENPGPHLPQAKHPFFLPLFLVATVSSSRLCPGCPMSVFSTLSVFPFM